MKIAALILVLSATTIALFLTAFASEKKVDAKLQELIDEREIVNVVNSIGIEADRRNWSAVENAFAAEVALDYSSMGAKVETLKPAQITANWKTILPGFKMTQHAITNHRVMIKDRSATCFSYVTALHYLPNNSKNDVWRVVGFYEHHLVKTEKGWRVKEMKFTATLVDGNLELPKFAVENVKNNITPVEK